MTLERLAGAWRRRWTIAAAAAVLATILLGRAITGRLIWGLVAGLVAAAWWWRLRRPVDARAVARHLNRTQPALEESAELLARDEATLSTVERLQRERTQAAFTRLGDPRLPHRPWRWGLGYAGAAFAVSALLLVLPGRGLVSGRSTDLRPPASPALGVGDVEIVITPPGYTGRGARTLREWEVEVEAGSIVRWRVAVAPATTGGALITSAGDTAALAPGDDGTMTASLEIERSVLYFVAVRDSTGRTITADFHQLTVIPDAPPTITVLSPDPRTEVAPDSTAAVQLRVLVGDDYGVRDTRLIATLTTGQGEGVTFREQEMAFDRSAQRPDGRRGALLERLIDPRALGLGPGDELYFHVVARDNRQPEPQSTRSETYFITLLDTAQALVADFTGIAVNLVPEYFRSQRQIILDTERLLAERSRIDSAEFRARSENIGLDQHLLRLRYGEIVGDEVVEGAEPDERHDHDIEDNATRLAPEVKAALQASLAQMWQAELKLRLSDPQAALPFEYRALELLKEVQQAARAYVRRVGFEPPPLEPDRKRLTGDLSRIGRPRVTRDLTARDSLPAVRSALESVRRLARGAGASPADVAALEGAAPELAALAVAEPGRHLETLRALRTLLDSTARGRACDCLHALEGGLLRALPVPTPSTGGAAPAGGVARTYFDLLREP